MNQRILSFLCGVGLILTLLVASGWAYWYEKSFAYAWVVEMPEQIVLGATLGQELQIAFLLQNTSSSPRRILGVEAC